MTVVDDTADLVATAADTVEADQTTIRSELDGVSVASPQATADTRAGTVVRLYSWTAEQGIVLRWNLTVRNGSVVHRQATAVSVGLGTHLGPDGFAPSEGAVVVVESLATTDTNTARPASVHTHPPNLTVSNNHVTVFENGSAETTTISLGEFGSGDERVTVNVSIEGTRIKNRSGNRLRFSTDAEGNGSVQFTPPADLYSGRTCIEANSSSEDARWCITDRTTGDDNNTMDDERGLLTIEEAKEKTTSGAGGSITYVAKYTDQNLDSVIATDSNLSQTESDRQFLVDNVLDTMTTIYQNQVVQLGFDKYVGQQFEGNKRLPVLLNDGKWAFHRVRSTKAFLSGSQNGGPRKSITYNLKYGYTNNLTSHTRTVMAHEHFHIVQYSYFYYGSDRHLKNWYAEGQALFMQTLADPAIMQDRRSAFYWVVNRYLDNPDRRSLANHSYDYGVFWLYMYKQMGIDSIEETLVEMNNVSGSDVDTYGPTALDRVIRDEPGYDSYREFMIEFHTDVYRATLAGDSGPFETNRDWTKYMDPVDRTYETLASPDDVDRTNATVEPWGVDYYQLDTRHRASDGTYLKINRSDVYTRTIRVGLNSLSRNPDTIVERGNITSVPGGQLPVTPNNTLYHGSEHKQMGLLVAPLDDDGNKSYSVTFRSNTTDHRLTNRLDERREEALYLVPVNKNKPAGLTGQYGSQGDLFVSVHPSSIQYAGRTGGPRDLRAKLTLASGTGGAGTVTELNTSESSNTTELVAPVDDSDSSVWKLSVEERSSTPADPGTFFVRSNYLAGNSSGGAPTDQLFGMPTETELLTGTTQAGSIGDPKPITLRVNVSNGDTRYQHKPFPRPDPSHFRVSIDGTPVSTGRISVVMLGPGQFQLMIDPPTQASAGTYQICAAFSETKFGVTETTPSTCGSVTYEPGLGTPVIIGPPIIDILDPTPVVQTRISTGEDNDTVSLVTTSEEGSTTAVQSTQLGGNRAELRASTNEAIGSLDPAGAEADIAAGLEGGLALAQESSAGKQGVILVSRGNAVGSTEDIVGAYADEGVPVHVVAVGENANSDLLQRIADRTGGTFHQASTMLSLKTAFDRIDAAESREGVLDREPATPGQETVTLDSTEPLSRTFSVDDTAGPTVVRVDLTGVAAGNATVQLVDPEGTVISREAAPESVTYSRFEGTVVYRLEDPQPGTWTYEVSMPEYSTEGTDPPGAAVRVTTQSRTALAVSTDKGTGGFDGGTYRVGQPVTIGAQLVGPDGGLDDAEVTAMIAHPDMETEEVTLEYRGNGSYGIVLPTGDGERFGAQGRYIKNMRAVRGDVVRNRQIAWRVEPQPFRPMLELGSASIEPGESTTVPLVAESLPNGVQQVDARVCLQGDTGVGALGEVTSELGPVTVEERTDRCLSFSVTDENGVAEPGAEGRTLATLTLSETVPGTADIALSLERTDELLVDDAGEQRAVRTRAGSLTVEPTETRTVTVVVDRAPHGLHAFNVTVDTPAPVVNVQPGAVTRESFTVTDGGIGAESLRVHGVDYNDQAGPSKDPLVLAEITYAGTGTDATLSVHDLRNDNGTLQPRDPKGEQMDPSLIRFQREEPPEESDEPVANLTASLSERTVRPGNTLTLTLTLSNDGTTTGNATAINLTQWPAGWTVSSSNTGWKDRQLTWTTLANLGSGEEYQVTATADVPENTSEGDYVFGARGFVAAGVGADATTTLTVSEGFTVDKYDSDGDGSVAGDFTGVLGAIADYNTGDIGLTEVIQVIAAYNGGT